MLQGKNNETKIYFFLVLIPDFEKSPRPNDDVFKDIVFTDYCSSRFSLPRLTCDGLDSGSALRQLMLLMFSDKPKIKPFSW